ncbi:MAG: GTP-binding protein [Rhizobiales bacterium]|nr:GTP-binding protein [Hyphomicrobiales bacterium]
MSARKPPANDPAALSPEVLDPVVRAIEAEYQRKPPTLAVIGLSGVGKSSIINAMFGTKRDTSATTRGTSRFHKRNFEIVQAFDLESARVEATRIGCVMRLIDAPGLGEDVGLDDNYLARYRRHLPEADVALWVLAARNRALALDQQYLERLKDVLPNLVIGINQVDLVEPLGWNEAINMPSKVQAGHIAEIVADRRAKLGAVLGSEPPTVAFSALRFFNLQQLFATCLEAAPANRRWMFELLKSFSTRDWLAQAKGLTDTQRQQLAARYITSDGKLDLDDLAGLTRS